MIKIKQIQHFVILPVSHKLLPCKRVCVRACGCTLLNEWFNDEMQLAWPTSSVGSLQYRIFLPFHLHSAAFLLRLPLGACFFGHAVDTDQVQIFAPLPWLFYFSLVKTVCKSILREFPTQACKTPLSPVQETHAAGYLRSHGGWERSPLVSLTNYSNMNSLLNMCFWCIHGLHAGNVDTNSLIKAEASGSLSQYAYILFLWDEFE